MPPPLQSPECCCSHSPGLHAHEAADGASATQGAALPAELAPAGHSSARRRKSSGSTCTPCFRTVESHDGRGKLFERLIIEKIAPPTLDESAFAPKNPDYAL